MPRLRRLSLEELESLAVLFEAMEDAGYSNTFHPFPLTRDTAFELVQKSQSTVDEYWLAFDEGSGAAVGFMMLRGWDEGYEVPALGVAVHPNSTGCGVGSELVQYAHERAMSRGSAEIMLKVHSDNLPARRLYEKFGYHFEKDSLPDGQLKARFKLA